MLHINDFILDLKFYAPDFFLPKFAPSSISLQTEDWGNFEHSSVCPFEYCLHKS